jgi:predicted ATPase
VLHTTQCEIILAECFLRDGQLALARSHLDIACTHRKRYGEDYLRAEIDRLEALLQQHENAPPEIVERHLINALETARGQSARLLELRATTTFAQILDERNERRRAVDILAPIYGWFTEGFDTADLKEARTLLDHLS